MVIYTQTRGVQQPPGLGLHAQIDTDTCCTFCKAGRSRAEKLLRGCRLFLTPAVDRRHVKPQEKHDRRSQQHPQIADLPTLDRQTSTDTACST